MDKNNLPIIIAAILLALWGIYYFSRLSNNYTQQELPGIILFSKTGCLRCENVEKFISENKVENKVKFARIEISQDNNSAELFFAKANFCGIPADDLGTPLLWDGSNCFLGDVDIVNFFKNKLNAK